MHTSYEPCARCDRNLAAVNTSPDRLCGLCQQELSSHQPKSARLLKWRAEGSKREVLRNGESVRRSWKAARGVRRVVVVAAAAPADPADDFNWSEVRLPWLLRAVAELRRREAEARAVIRAIGKRA